MLAAQAEGHDIETVESLANGKELSTLQQAFVDHLGAQCGFCTPGMLLTAKALLDQNPNPTEADVRDAISANLCRCTGYDGIVTSIMAAAAANNGGAR
jgi:carbon-monoxide dehydrogenase small subunit